MVWLTILSLSASSALGFATDKPYRPAPPYSTECYSSQLLPFVLFEYIAKEAIRNGLVSGHKICGISLIVRKNKFGIIFKMKFP